MDVPNVSSGTNEFQLDPDRNESGNNDFDSNDLDSNPDQGEDNDIEQQDEPETYQNSKTLHLLGHTCMKKPTDEASLKSLFSPLIFIF